MFRKVSLALFAALAISAMSFSALASADWTHSTEKVASKESITVAGSVGFTGGIGGFSCSEATGEGTMSPGTTGQFESYIINPSSCKGTGALAGCTAVSATSTGLPWTVHTDGEVMYTTELHLHKTFSGVFCPYHEITLKGAKTTITPDDLHAATEGTLAAVWQAYNGTTGAFITNVNITGSGTVTPSGTYGIT